MDEKIVRFEDLIARQKTRILTAAVCRTTSEGLFGKDFGLREQIRRAAVSTMSNIAEGFERGTPPEFHRFLSMAKASCAELRSQLYVALDVGYLREDPFNALIAQADEVGRIIGGLRISTRRRREV
jgi:four helix bundle protein